MKRPEPTEWKTTDKELAKLLSDIKHAYDVNSWTFTIPNENRNVKYKEILVNLNKSYPDKVWIAAIKSWFHYLPQQLQIMEKDLRTLFKNYTLKIQEQVNYIKDLEKYIDSQESILKDMNEQLDKHNKEKMEQLHKERLALYDKREQDLSTIKDHMSKIAESIITLSNHMGVETKPIKPEPKTERFIHENSERFLEPIIDPHPNPKKPNKKVTKKPAEPEQYDEEDLI